MDTVKIEIKAKDKELAIEIPQSIGIRLTEEDRDYINSKIFSVALALNEIANRR